MTPKKLDNGKAPMWRGLLSYFPRALRAVGAVSQMGHDKYGSWGGWRFVEGADGRYADALIRHLDYHASGETIDTESGLPHLAHAAWNALAILELALDALPTPVEPGVVPSPLLPTEPNPASTDARRPDLSVRYLGKGKVQLQEEKAAD